MALARALAIEPKVLLLDEPFGALDAQVRTQLRHWLRDLHDTLHVTTVLVTHDQEEAMEVADRLAIINHGRLEQVGTPADMYDHPANEFVLTFLGPGHPPATASGCARTTWPSTGWRTASPPADAVEGTVAPRHPPRLRGPGRRRPRRGRDLLGPAEPRQRGRARPGGGPAGLGGADRGQAPGPVPDPQRAEPVPALRP